MILGGKTIRDEYNAGKIIIDPYDDDCVGPNSYDVHLGNEIKLYRYETEDFMDIHIDGKLRIDAGMFVLASTIEKIGSDHYVPMLEGRSSIGRMGLFVHVTAGFGDVGFKDQWTLELVTTIPVKIYPGMRIAQVFFHTATDTSIKYNGRYVGQSGPTESRLYSVDNNKKP